MAGTEVVNRSAAAICAEWQADLAELFDERSAKTSCCTIVLAE